MNKTLIFFIVCMPYVLFSQNIDKYLIPYPKNISVEKIPSAINLEELIILLQNIESLEFTGTMQPIGKSIAISFSIDSTLDKQGYSLNIKNNTVSIVGQNSAGLHYGRQTLTQLMEYAVSENEPLPEMTINDWPDFERRGYMLDISRDKVPTMQTLYRLVDYLASWKINELQLYTEHTFAYKNHSIVWEDSSPMTAEEIQELNDYCRKYYIDLVPNQNSFGHMENWLKHDEYLQLAECPTDCKTAWGTRKRHSLNPQEPKSFELMQELYAELLPNFSSEYFNIGCDETVELGCGKSKNVCNEKGKGVVYLDFVKKLNAEANKHGKTAQFWGDIILNHPELIKDIPQNMIAMVWGYESNYPFNERLPKFKDAGLDFYVCPGTATWRSIIGRNYHAFLNLKNAAVNGKKYGAKGYLNTNWGDLGHWQPMSVCYPAMLVGAAYSWNCSDKTLENLEFHLNHYVYKDTTGNTAKAILKLGNSYLKTKLPEGNANAYQLMLRRYKWTMKGHFQTKQLTEKGLQNAEKEIDNALEILKLAKPESYDAQIIIDELQQAGALAKHGIHLGLARLSAPKEVTLNIPRETKKELIDELTPIIQNHRKLWIVRNRVGGLDNSAKYMEDLLLYYKQ